MPGTRQESEALKVDCEGTFQVYCTMFKQLGRSDKFVTCILHSHSIIMSMTAGAQVSSLKAGLWSARAFQVVSYP